MYFGKATFLFVLAVCVTINAVAIKRRTMKSKVKKANIQKIVAPPCGCKNPAIDFKCDCRGSIIEAALGALAPFEIPACQSAIVDVPNYRYTDPKELSPLSCLFPTIEIPNYGMLTAPMTLPSVEYFTAVEPPCGCPGPKCGCRAPAVKVPACPREFLASIEVPSCGCQGLLAPSVPVGQIIELPSYAPAPVIQIPACRGSIAPACGCQGPCSCSGIPMSSCGCQGPCSCPEYRIASCGCQGPCTCPDIRIAPCGCQGPCSCPEYQILSCGCQGSCSCLGVPAACGCQGPCGCGRMPCGCQGVCSCSGVQTPVALMPGIQAPCTCGDCPQYLRQVTLQPPFL